MSDDFVIDPATGAAMSRAALARRGIPPRHSRPEGRIAADDHGGAVLLAPRVLMLEPYHDASGRTRGGEQHTRVAVFGSVHQPLCRRYGAATIGFRVLEDGAGPDGPCRCLGRGDPALGYVQVIVTDIVGAPVDAVVEMTVEGYLCE